MKTGSRRWKPGETRSLNGDERISFSVLALYLFIFCICTYLFWPSLPLKIVGGTAAILGLLLFSTALLNQGTLPRKHSQYTIRWYLISFLFGLIVLIGLRYVARHVENHSVAASIILGSLLTLLLAFRKTILQILMVFLALSFLSVTAANWNKARSGEIKFLDALRQSGRVIFQIQPIEDVANTLIAGNYAGYLNKVNYRDEQLNMVAVRKVRQAGDDDLKKTRILLNFVSNEIMYVSDPDDGYEYAKDPVSTLISGGGDCEDQTVLICSLLESVGVKTYMGFTADHVFALVSFRNSYSELAGIPYVLINDQRGYIVDAADPDAVIGYGAAEPKRIEHIFDVRSKGVVRFSVP
ncbi:transglutaminase-like domain-containing protein [Pontiellaceae bacterium B12227]|nr:transglutaminase-like domain-containing protein [Pontiellaceae bacterium B12227]